MSELNELLELSKSVAKNAAQRLLNCFNHEHKHYVYCVEHPREIKAVADTVLERYILQALQPTGLSILSEECGYIPGRQESQYWFIVDPLDGTFNFIKGLGPSAVSIALWKDQEPVLGVVYRLPEQQLFWGGATMGSYADGHRISVSSTWNKAQASVCTGFPVRFDSDNDLAKQNFWRKVSPYAKVRMLGSASVSLLHVAAGSADVYLEDSIMLWDVAAGLPIVEGAGGAFVAQRTDIEWSYNIFAGNKYLVPNE